MVDRPSTGAPPHDIGLDGPGSCEVEIYLYPRVLVAADDDAGPVDVEE